MRDRAEGGRIRVNDWFRSARLLSWMTQFGLSVAVPLVGCILLAVWLQGRFGLGGWGWRWAWCWAFWARWVA